MKVVTIEHLVPLPFDKKSSSSTIINLDANELGVYPDYIKKHNHLIQKETHTTTNFRIAIFPSHDIQRIINLYSAYESIGEVQLVGEIEHLTNQVKEIENKYQLVIDSISIRKTIYESLTEKYKIPIFLHEVSYASKNSFEKTSHIIEFDQIGLLTIGMENEFFYANKINGEFYFDKKNIENFSSYFSSQWIDLHSWNQKDTIDYFNKNFLNNFEEDKSIYYVWWN